MKQSLSSLQSTQTHVHILTVEKRKAVLALGEGQTSRVPSADEMISSAARPTPSSLFPSHGLMHTLRLLHTLEWYRLCVASEVQRAKQRHWYRDSSLYCIYTTKRRPSFYSDTPWGQLRDSITISGVWQPEDRSVLVGVWRVQINSLTEGGDVGLLCPSLKVLSTYWRPVFFFIVIILSFFIISVLHSGELRAFRVTQRSKVVLMPQL